ncbi:hypothetical protein QCA50_018102 [Cerrena zonata]|uniref:JmjC domain-containing protein n=1 Tax=Cerrena zonata TaxID=2478898 RepID=A0AAW0FHZ8_9APHY
MTGPSSTNYPTRHPAWPYADCDLYKVGLQDGEYLETAGDITWPSGVRTVLPFLPSTEESISTPGVQSMAHTTDDLLAPKQNRIAAIIALGTDPLSPTESHALNKWIRIMLSRGRPVIIHKTPMSSTVDLTEEGFQTLRSDLDKTIVVQEELASYNACNEKRQSDKGKKVAWRTISKSKREQRHILNGPEGDTEDDDQGTTGYESTDNGSNGLRIKIHAYDNPNREGTHVNLTIREFIRCRFNPRFCGNWLASATVFSAGAPMFIQGVSDDSIAAASCMDVDTQSDHRKDPFSQDWVRCKTWSLACHAASWTPWHRDSNGLCTWGLVMSGVKVWGYCIPVRRVLDLSTRMGLDEQIFSPEPNLYGMRQGHVFLTTGSTIIQPPGLIHTVFTPLSAVMCGGHFYCYDTMAATEMAMRLDKKGTLKKTNDHHISCIPMMVRMVLAIPSVYRDTIPFDTIAAFGAILGDPHFYKVTGFKKDTEAATLLESEAIEADLLQNAKDFLYQGLVKSGEVQAESKWHAIAIHLRKMLDAGHHIHNEPTNIYMLMTHFKG